MNTKHPSLSCVLFSCFAFSLPDVSISAHGSFLISSFSFCVIWFSASLLWSRDNWILIFFSPANYKSLSFNGMNSVRCHFCKTRDFASFHFLLLLIYFLAFEDLTTRTLWKNWHILDATWIVIDICIIPCDSRGLLWDFLLKCTCFIIHLLFWGGDLFPASWAVDGLIHSINIYWTLYAGTSLDAGEKVCVIQS